MFVRRVLAAQPLLRGGAAAAAAVARRACGGAASQRVERLADELQQLSVLEAAQLATLLKTRLGLPDVVAAAVAAPGAGGAGGAAGAAAPEPEKKEEKTSFDVKLLKFNEDSRIKLLKEIRTVTQLGLKEAKDLMTSAPTVIKGGIPKEMAEELKKKLEEAGGVVSVE